MAIPLDASSTAAITHNASLLAATIYTGRSIRSQVYMPDLQLIASYYKDWATAAGVWQLATYGDFPPIPAATLGAVASQGSIAARLVGGRCSFGAIVSRNSRPFLVHVHTGDATGKHLPRAITQPKL